MFRGYQTDALRILCTGTDSVGSRIMGTDSKDIDMLLVVSCG